MAAVEATLDDGAVMDFVASGYVLLEGVIDDSFNQRCNDLDRGNINAFIASDAFTDTVLLHPQVAGVADGPRYVGGAQLHGPIVGHLRIAHQAVETLHVVVQREERFDAHSRLPAAAPTAEEPG